MSNPSTIEAEAIQIVQELAIAPRGSEQASDLCSRANALVARIGNPQPPPLRRGCYCVQRQAHSGGPTHFHGGDFTFRDVDADLYRGIRATIADMHKISDDFAIISLTFFPRDT